MPAVVDLNLLPNMGRMTPRSPSGVKTGCSPVQKAAARRRPSPTPWSKPPSSTASIRKPGSPIPWPVSPTIRSPASTSCCPGVTLRP